MRFSRPAARRRERGFLLLATGVMVMLALAALGVAVDLGRMAVVRSEAQACTDAAALRGAALLDGTPAGLRAAAAAVAAPAGRWDLGHLSFPRPECGFSDSSSGPWRPAEVAAVNSRYQRVRVSLNLKLYFLPLVDAGGRGTVAAESIAGQVEKTAFDEGVFPMAVEGARPEPGRVAVWREPVGFGRVGQSLIRQEIIDGVQGGRLSLGDRLELAATPSEAAWTAIEARLAQDTDTESADFSAYQKRNCGNGRRIVVSPLVEAGAGGSRVSGFGAFFLRPGRGGAEYAGAWVQGRVRIGMRGAYVVRLVG